MSVTETLKFKMKKETKGAVCYGEVGDDGQPAFAPKIGTLYVRKTAFPSGRLVETLELTMKWGNYKD